MTSTLPPEEQNRFDDLDQKIAEASHKAGILTDKEKQELAKRQKDVMHSSASAGVEFAAVIIITTFLGIWLDKQTGTAPLFMLIFIVLGGVISFYNLYRASENLPSTPTNVDSQLHPDQKNVTKTPNKK